MTDVSALEVAIESPARKALTWAGPLVFGLLGLLGAVNRWIGPLGLGALIDEAAHGVRTFAQRYYATTRFGSCPHRRSGWYR